MRTDLSWLRRPGVAAAVGVTAIAAVVGSVGVADATQDWTIYAIDKPGSGCFSTSDNHPCVTNERPEITIRTGDKVIWDFSVASIHNAASKPDTGNAPWQARKSDYQQSGTQEWIFGNAGRYDFLCEVHPGMEGTIFVEGDPVVTPGPSETPTTTETPQPTATFAVTAPPGATATPDNHTNTPAPGKAARTDKQAPALTGAKAKAVSAGAKLTFSVSEPVTLKLTARRGQRTVTSATLHVAAGKRSVTLRSSSLRKPGTYSLEWRAVDAMANAAKPVKTTLKVKR